MFITRVEVDGTMNLWQS